MVDNRNMIDNVHNFAADSTLRACGITTAPLLDAIEKAVTCKAQEELVGITRVAVER